MESPSRSPILVRLADLDHPDDGRHVVELLDMYSQEPLGQAVPLPGEVRERLVRDEPCCKRPSNWRYSTIAAS
jgi:hypothetical protein